MIAIYKAFFQCIIKDEESSHLYADTDFRSTPGTTFILISRKQTHVRPCSVPPGRFISRAGSELGQSRAAQTRRGPGAHLSATRKRGLRATSAAQLRARALNHHGPRQQNNPGDQALWPLGLMLIDHPGSKETTFLHTSLWGPNKYRSTTHVANTNDLESPQLLQLQKFCHRRTARTALKYGRQQERAETPGGSKGLRTSFLVTAKRMSSSKRHPHMPETPSHPQSPSWFCLPSRQQEVTDKAQTERKGEWSPAPPKGLPSKPAVQKQTPREATSVLR